MDKDGGGLREGLDKAGLREVNIKVVEKELHHAENTGGVLLCRKYKEYFQKNKAGEESLLHLDKDLDRQRKEYGKKLSQSERRFITVQVIRKDLNPYILPDDSVASQSRKRRLARSREFSRKIDEHAPENKDIDNAKSDQNVCLQEDMSALQVEAAECLGERPQSPPQVNAIQINVETVEPTSEMENCVDGAGQVKTPTSSHGDKDLILPEIKSVTSNSPIKMISPHGDHEQNEQESVQLPMIDVTQSCDNFQSGLAHNDVFGSQLSKSADDLHLAVSTLTDLEQAGSYLQREISRADFKQLRDRFRTLKASLQEPKEKPVDKLHACLSKPKLSKPVSKKKVKEKSGEKLQQQPTCGHAECRFNYIKCLFQEEEEQNTRDDIVYNKLVDKLRSQLPKSVATKLEAFRAKLNDGKDYESVLQKRLERSRKSNSLRALDDPRWLQLEETMKKPPIVLRRRIKVAKPKTELYDRSRLRFFAATNWMG